MERTHPNVIEHLREVGVWPTFGQLDRPVDIILGADLVDLIAATPAKYMPLDEMDVLGRRETDLWLTHIALHDFGADDLLVMLVGSLRYAAERERSDPLSQNGTVGVTGKELPAA